MENNICLRDNCAVVADLYYDFLNIEDRGIGRGVGDLVWCLPVLYSQSEDEENKWQLDGLIIKRAAKALHSGRWERLGKFTVYSDDIDNKIGWPSLRDDWFGRQSYGEREIILV